ncbi:MAG TPA: hypothetical protein VKT19_02885 [Steroidobacteraceae bacterium]|nr:hypothetical protein [Steroidobacteraceae bacterium]
MQTITRGKRASLAGGALAAWATLAFMAAGPALAQDQSAAATWQHHKTTFNYLGFTPTYSCMGLEDALSYLLEQSGARLDHPVWAYPCNGSAPTKLLMARLDFSTLQPAADAASNPSGTARGVWRHVDISAIRSNPRLHGSDCELVDEFRATLLPMFATRNVRSNLHCIPYQTDGNLFDLSFDVLALPDAAHHGGSAD